jgi:hypothetical protein
LLKVKHRTVKLSTPLEKMKVQITAVTEEHVVLKIKRDGNKKDTMVSCFNFLRYIRQNTYLYKELFTLVNFCLLSDVLYMISERLINVFYSWKYI